MVHNKSIVRDLNSMNALGLLIAAGFISVSQGHLGSAERI